MGLWGGISYSVLAVCQDSRRCCLDDQRCISFLQWRRSHLVSPKAVCFILKISGMSRWGPPVMEALATTGILNAFFCLKIFFKICTEMSWIRNRAQVFLFVRFPSKENSHCSVHRRTTSAASAPARPCGAAAELRAPTSRLIGPPRQIRLRWCVRTAPGPLGALKKRFQQSASRQTQLDLWCADHDDNSQAIEFSSSFSNCSWRELKTSGCCSPLFDNTSNLRIQPKWSPFSRCAWKERRRNRTSHQSIWRYVEVSCAWAARYFAFVGRKRRTFLCCSFLSSRTSACGVLSPPFQGFRRAEFVVRGGEVKSCNKHETGSHFQCPVCLYLEVGMSEVWRERNRVRPSRTIGSLSTWKRVTGWTQYRPPTTMSSRVSVDLDLFQTNEFQNLPVRLWIKRQKLSR